MKRSLFLLACLAMGACSHAAPDGRNTLEQLRAIGRDAACTSDQQCRTVPMGAKPCGGPEAFMAYSTAKADPAKVGELAERFRKEREAANAEAGVSGDCRAVTDPGAVCRAGSCQLGRNAEI